MCQPYIYPSCSTSCHVNYCFAQSQSDIPPLVRLICERLLPANMFYSTQLKDNTEDNTMKYQNTSVQIAQRMNISKKTLFYSTFTTAQGQGQGVVNVITIGMLSKVSRAIVGHFREWVTIYVRK